MKMLAVGIKREEGVVIIFFFFSKQQARSCKMRFSVSICLEKVQLAPMTLCSWGKAMVDPPFLPSHHVKAP